MNVWLLDTDPGVHVVFYVLAEKKHIMTWWCVFITAVISITTTVTAVQPPVQPMLSNETEAQLATFTNRIPVLVVVSNTTVKQGIVEQHFRLMNETQLTRFLDNPEVSPFTPGAGAYRHASLRQGGFRLNSNLTRVAFDFTVVNVGMDSTTNPYLVDVATHLSNPIYGGPRVVLSLLLSTNPLIWGPGTNALANPPLVFNALIGDRRKVVNESTGEPFFWNVFGGISNAGTSASTFTTWRADWQSKQSKLPISERSSPRYGMVYSSSASSAAVIYDMRPLTIINDFPLVLDVTWPTTRNQTAITSKLMADVRQSILNDLVFQVEKAQLTHMTLYCLTSELIVCNEFVALMQSAKVLPSHGLSIPSQTMLGMSRSDSSYTIAMMGFTSSTQWTAGSQSAMHRVNGKSLLAEPFMDDPQRGIYAPQVWDNYFMQVFPGTSFPYTNRIGPSILLLFLMMAQHGVERGCSQVKELKDCTGSLILNGIQQGSLPSAAGECGLSNQMASLSVWNQGQVQMNGSLLSITDSKTVFRSPLPSWTDRQDEIEYEYSVLYGGAIGVTLLGSLPVTLLLDWIFRASLPVSYRQVRESTAGQRTFAKVTWSVAFSIFVWAALSLAVWSHTPTNLLPDQGEFRFDLTFILVSLLPIFVGSHATLLMGTWLHVNARVNVDGSLLEDESISHSHDRDGDSISSVPTTKNTSASASYTNKKKPVMSLAPQKTASSLYETDEKQKNPWYLLFISNSKTIKTNNLNHHFIDCRYALAVLPMSVGLVGGFGLLVNSIETQYAMVSQTINIGHFVVTSLLTTGLLFLGWSLFAMASEHSNWNCLIYGALGQVAIVHATFWLGMVGLSSVRALVETLPERQGQHISVETANLIAILLFLFVFGFALVVTLILCKLGNAALRSAGRLLMTNHAHEIKDLNNVLALMFVGGHVPYGHGDFKLYSQIAQPTPSLKLGSVFSSVQIGDEKSNHTDSSMEALRSRWQEWCQKPLPLLFWVFKATRSFSHDQLLCLLLLRTVEMLLWGNNRSTLDRTPHTELAAFVRFVSNHCLVTDEVNLGTAQLKETMASVRKLLEQSPVKWNPKAFHDVVNKLMGLIGSNNVANLSALECQHLQKLCNDPGNSLFQKPSFLKALQGVLQKYPKAGQLAVTINHNKSTVNTSVLQQQQQQADHPHQVADVDKAARSSVIMVPHVHSEEDAQKEAEVLKDEVVVSSS